MSDAYRSTSKDCSLCDLHHSRSQVVFPDVFRNSSEQLTTLVIGEAPGAKEDEKGIPFVGASGKLLRKELGKLPGKVIITNTVKCRPPKNRDPKKDEKEACAPFLQKEIDHFDPQLIILVGRHAAGSLLTKKQIENFSESSGKVFDNNRIPIIHPASTMYNAKKNKPIWEESWQKIFSYIESKHNLKVLKGETTASLNKWL